MSDQLFWVDAGRNNKIEVARSDGTHRKTLISQGLDKPRALALYPKYGWVYCLYCTLSYRVAITICRITPTLGFSLHFKAKQNGLFNLIISYI